MLAFRADWIDLRFVHFRVDPAALQPFVPHPLDRYAGAAYVSLVAFEQRRFRPAGTGAPGALLFQPVASHLFLNVRTLVRRHGEPGIFFLAEWVPRRWAAFFGPRTWGLPYRLGRLDYRHDPRGASDCSVTAAGDTLRFETSNRPGPPSSTPRGSRDEFLLERYVAFTARGERALAFRVAHPRWRVVDLTVDLVQDDLLRQAFAWYRNAELVGGHGSSGFVDVALSPPAASRQSGATERSEQLHHGQQLG